MDSDTIPIIIIIFCLILSAFFSATETAYSSLNRLNVKSKAEKGNKRAKLVLRLTDNYDSLLSTILIGNNIVNIASASLATVLFVKNLGGEMGPTISTVVMTVVVLVFCEVSPKSIAKESAEKFAMFSAPFVNILVIIFTPLNFVFKLWKNLLSKIFKSKEDTGITDEEILYMVEEAEQDGGIDEQESELIRSAIEFTEQEAIDILTPRIDITAVSTEATKEEISKIFAETGYSRLPVYEDTIDHITGIIYEKDFHNYVYRTEKKIKDIIKPAIFVPRSKKISSLLRELQQKKSHIAIVLDEFGGTVGIVTLEDILEELVGEIWDEHDEVSNDITIKSEDVFEAQGNTSLDRLFEFLDIDATDEELQTVTINGWLMDSLERVPKVGDFIEYKGFTVKVIRMDENRIEKVEITGKKKEDDGESEE